MNIIHTQRKSNVLVPSSLKCLANMPAVNLTSGCAHGCVYCYAQGYSTYPGHGKVVVYDNTLEKLRSELSYKRNKPLAVYFSPSSDIFQPIPDVIELGYAILEFLFSKNIGVSFLTKGYIPEKTLSLLLNNAEKVKAQIGIITVDENIRCIFEPNTASIDVRLKQMERMVTGGIVVEARMMPVLPGITDNPNSIDSLFSAIAGTGIKRVAISTLFLRPSIAASLRQLVQDNNIVQNILDLYRNTGRIEVHAKNSSVIPLAREKREKSYAEIKTIAEKHNIEVSICGCMNPDIGGTCNINGNWVLNKNRTSLFDRPSEINGEFRNTLPLPIPTVLL
ncbi:MAG: SPL family radical SAM protein [Dehalococcoidales bacterium]